LNRLANNIRSPMNTVMRHFSVCLSLVTFATLSGTFSYNSIDRIALKETASNWAQFIPELSVEEALLLANTLYLTTKLSRLDRLVRTSARHLTNIHCTMCNNALTIQDQPYTPQQAAKTVAFFLKLSADYRTTYKIWKACLTFLKEQEQLRSFSNVSDLLSDLLEYVRTTAAQETESFLIHNQDAITEIIAQTGQSYARLGKTTAMGLESFYKLLVQSQNKQTEQNISLAEIDATSRMADFMRTVGWDGVKTALASDVTLEAMETISWIIFTTYYHKVRTILSLAEVQAYVMFDENGLIPEENRCTLLPVVN